MAALSWEEIVERGKQHNKTVICEVEKRGCHRCFRVKCNICGSEKEEIISRFFRCFQCSCKKKTNDYGYFISKSKKIHGNKYNYDFVEYVHSKSKVKILCNKCNNIFEQIPYNHLRGRGCPKCNESKGEIKVAKYLTENNISFIPQKTFKTLRDKRHLKLDFY